MRIVGDGDAYTFGAFLENVRSISYRLQTEGLQFGDRVALIGENHPNWALSYLGILYRGAVCVPIDPHGETETITNFLENSEAKLAFIGAEFKERFKLILEKLGRHIPAVVWDKSSEKETGFDPANQPFGEENGFRVFEDWASTEYPESYAREAPAPEGTDLALLIYTSGTTGMPKGVPLTHGNILAELDGINEILKLTDKETILSLLPLFHAYLQIVNLWVATTYGCQAGYLKELSPAELSNAMAEFRPTILTTVPRLWYLFHKKIFDAVDAKPRSVQMLFRAMLAFNGFTRDVFRINLGRTFFGKVHDGFGGKLRLAISAGSRFDEQVARDFHRLGFTILQGYGLTETSGAATATYENDNRVGSVGKPMFNAEIRIDRPDSEGVGEVLIRGPIVFDGYYKNPAATVDAFTEDGWFRSGDLGRLDDGHLYIVGRAKDVIVLPSGKNVHPEDLEVHYLKAPEVEELAVLGVTDETESRAGAEKLIAVVVPDFEYLKHAKIVNSREAIRYALDNLGRELPEYQRVRDYIVRAEPLPRTATRKIKRFELKKEIETGQLSAGIPEKRSWSLSTDDEAFLSGYSSSVVVSTLKKHAGDAEVIHPNMNLEIDLGLDSLARAEVFAALEHAFDSEFTAEQAAAATQVRNVIDLVRSTPKGRELDIDSSAGLEVKAELNWSRIVRDADEDMPEVRGILRRRTFFPAFAFLVYRGFNLFCRVFMRLEVEGLDNLDRARHRNGTTEKRSDAFLICPNHQSFLDPFVLCSNYPFEIFTNIFHVGAKMFFESRTMRFIAKMLNVVPIDQDTQLMRAMKAGAIGLKRGKILNIYPEGERAFDGKLHEFKKGAAILATELDLPIVPVAIDGLYKVWARRSWKIRPAKVRIRIGEPFYPREVLATIGREHATGDDKDYEVVTSHLKTTIAGMIEEMRAASDPPASVAKLNK
jgi:long-chain acyl-CoA synthetase